MAEEWDVFRLQPDGDVYEAQPEYLTTLYEARQKTIRVELNGTGSGSFAVNRHSPECTETVLAQGNLVKVRIPEIDDDYVFAFFLETGDFTLISSEEEGGEMLTFGGRGILSYLEYARAWNESYIDGGQDPIAGVWRAYNAGTGSKPGQILRRLLEEFQDPDRPQAPIPYLTIDFDYDDDSTSDTWDDTDATDEFSYQVGEDGLAIVKRLLETETIRVQMDPEFLLHAYNVDTYGRDLSGGAFGSGVVRFERGVNIATELRRELPTGGDMLGGGGGVPDTHILVQGESDKYGTAALSDAATRVTKEAFLAAFGTGTTALAGIGAVELNKRLGRSEQIMFPIANRRTADVVLSDPVSVGATLGDTALDGFYLPGPEGTNGDFWVGDTVRVHTGSEAFDYDEIDAVVEAITISRNDENAELDIIVELKTGSRSVSLDEIKFAKQEFSAVTITWDVAPVEGQLLVAILTMRAGDGWGTIPAGWTVIDPPTVAEDFVTIGVNGNVLTEYPAGMAYKYATAGETQSPAFTNIRSTGAGVACFYKLSGFSGPPIVVSKDEQGAASSFGSGNLTPTAGVGAVLIGFFSCKIGEFTPASYTPGTNITEDMDAAAGIGADYEYYAPRSFSGHRLIESTSGSYALSATASQSGEWCGMAVMFTGS